MTSPFIFCRHVTNLHNYIHSKQSGILRFIASAEIFLMLVVIYNLLRCVCGCGCGCVCMACACVCGCARVCVCVCVCVRVCVWRVHVCVCVCVCVQRVCVYSPPHPLTILQTHTPSLSCPVAQVTCWLQWFITIS